MASNPIPLTDRVVTMPGTMPPMPAVARILARYDRPSLEAFISIAIDLADTLDGDSDFELNGDELDGNGAEDCFCDHNEGGNPMPGCPISDPGEEECDIEADDGDGGLCVPYGIDQRQPLLPRAENVDQRELASLVLKRIMIAPDGAETHVRA